MKICYSCFKEFVGGYHVCPHCGHEEITAPKEPIYLYPGTVLRNKKGRQYIIGEAIGAGGFGTVYKAFDTTLETVIAVKEFFISRLMTRTPGQEEVLVYRKAFEEYNYRKNRFLAEARAMASCSGSQNIPAVFDYFEENNTAYIVMEYLDGIALNNYLKKKGKIGNPAAAVKIASDIGLALETLHSKKIIHRDVAPDNIYICRGKPNVIKLLDLGAAKLQDETDEAIDIVLKPGYSPPEQYEENGKIGPWSDVYALGATLYMMLTGIKPEESTNRKIEDRLLPPNAIDTTISENLSNAVMKAMAVDRHMRFKTIGEFIRAINGEKKIIPLVKERKRKNAKRVLSVAVACLLVFAVSFSVFRIFDSKREFFESTDLTIWYLDEKDSNGNSMKEYGINSYISSFKDELQKDYGAAINIEITPYSSADDYMQALKSADSLPTIFESTLINDLDILNKATDLDSVFKSDEFESSEILVENYEGYYANHKKLPLEFEIPVAFVRLKGLTYLDLPEDMNTFSSLDNLLTNMKKTDGQPFENGKRISVDEKNQSLIEENFGQREEYYKEGSYFTPVVPKEFLQGANGGQYGNSTAILLSSSKRLNDNHYRDGEVYREEFYEKKLKDKYKKFEDVPSDVIPAHRKMFERVLFYAPQNGGKVLCHFTNEWSIGSCKDTNQQKVAEKFLSLMLGKEYQELYSTMPITMPLAPYNKEDILQKKITKDMDENKKEESFEQIVQAFSFKPKTA